MFQQLRTATIMLAAMTLLTGLLYPLAITGAGQLLFPHQANGSLIESGGRVTGSELIGQPFDDPKYFWGRPSATGPHPYNAASSSGSNLATGNQTQLAAIADRVTALKKGDPENREPVPADLVTASGSGLDPHISPAAARYQIGRVSKARRMSQETVRKLVEEHTTGRQIGILGEPSVNVLLLNMALDRAGAVQPIAEKTESL